MRFKKYVLSFLFAVCLIMPVVFLTSACKDNDKTPVQYICDVQNESGWNFYDVDSYSENGNFGTITTGAVNKGTSVSYDLFLRDDYDINTLKVYANETEIPLQRNSAYSTDVIIDTSNFQKAGKVTVENISCDTVLSVKCSYKKIKFKFVIDSGNDLTGDQRKILSDFSFNGDKTLGLLVNEDLFIELPYNEYAENGGMIFKCAYKVGYYSLSDYDMVENGYFSPLFTPSLNEYLIGLDNSVGNENVVAIKPENIDVNSYIVKFLNTSAIQIKATNLEDNLELLRGDLDVGVSAEREIEYEFTLNKEYNVDISNAELYVFDTKLERASETADKIVWKFNSKTNLPCQFVKQLELNSNNRIFNDSISYYGVTLKGLDFTNTSLSKISFSVDDKDFSSKLYTEYFTNNAIAYYYDLQNTVYVRYDASEFASNEYTVMVNLSSYEKRFGVFEIIKDGQAPVTINISEKLSLFENGIYKDNELGIKFSIYHSVGATEVTDIKSVDEIDFYYITFTVTEGGSFIVNLKA